jgi:hypothetical protein
MYIIYSRKFCFSGGGGHAPPSVPPLARPGGGGGLRGAAQLVELDGLRVLAVGGGGLQGVGSS